MSGAGGGGRDRAHLPGTAVDEAAGEVDAARRPVGPQPGKGPTAMAAARAAAGAGLRPTTTTDAATGFAQRQADVQALRAALLARRGAGSRG